MTESLWKVVDLIKFFSQPQSCGHPTDSSYAKDVVLSIYGSVKAWVYPDTSCVGDL